MKGVEVFVMFMIAYSTSQSQASPSLDGSKSMTTPREGGLVIIEGRYGENIAGVDDRFVHQWAD